jgi:hypothetical protein
VRSFTHNANAVVKRFRFNQGQQRLGVVVHSHQCRVSLRASKLYIFQSAVNQCLCCGVSVAVISIITIVVLQLWKEAKVNGEFTISPPLYLFRRHRRL